MTLGVRKRHVLSSTLTPTKELSHETQRRQALIIGQGVTYFNTFWVTGHDMATPFFSLMQVVRQEKLTCLKWQNREVINDKLQVGHMRKDPI